jgi:hypothetical protein
MTRREQILQLRKQGRTIRQIQKELGISSPSLVAYYLGKADVLNGVSKQRLIACLREIEANTPEPLRKHVTKTIEMYSAPNR